MPKKVKESEQDWYENMKSESDTESAAAKERRAKQKELYSEKKSLLKVRKKQGEGFWQGDIGE